MVNNTKIQPEQNTTPIEEMPRTEDDQVAEQATQAQFERYASPNVDALLTESYPPEDVKYVARDRDALEAGSRGEVALARLNRAAMRIGHLAEISFGGRLSRSDDSRKQRADDRLRLRL